MKNLQYLFLALAIISLASCGEDNYDSYTEAELPNDPVEIIVDNELTISLRGNEVNSTISGIAYESNDFYHLGSADIDVTCTDFGLEYKGNGILLNEFFSVVFFGNETGVANAFGGFTFILDGEPVGVIDLIYPNHCPNDNPFTVQYEQYDDRIRGTLNGEFWTFADSLVIPFDSCVNYVSVGVVEATFDLELIKCD